VAGTAARAPLEEQVTDRSRRAPAVLDGPRLAAAGLLAALLSTATAFAQGPRQTPPVSEDVAACLTCHGDPELSRPLGDGTTVSLFVDGQALAGSVHGGRLRCTDCHRGMDGYPHPERTYADRGAFRAAFQDTCKSCHFENYTKLLDGMHYSVLARGDARAPSCVECHGAHDVSHPAEPRTRVSQTCGRCHEGVARAYAASVHGRGLSNGGGDVPTCTDCHRAHDVAGPGRARWLMDSPRMCGSCHADEKRMAKHGLSTNVLQTYLADFHGATATLSGGADEGRVTAVCTDCHGVHDIARVDDPGSRVLKENLARTCERCHAGAGTSFPSAWLSHYEPSWEKAPLVYAVRVGYLVLIPFMIGGLVLQVLLHFWRVVVNR
jgi:predicted CXXCH cytochrome family protein